MSLNDLFIKLKGGKGSGNWGHVGRPGKRGGSISGGGLTAIGALSWSNPSQRKMLAEEIKFKREKLKSDFKDIASKLGYDESKIKYMGKGYPFSVAGQSFTAAADYNPETGVIRVFDGTIAEKGSTMEVNVGIMAHEVQHSKWNSFIQKSQQQGEEITKRLEGEVKSGVHYTESFMKPSGEFRNKADIKKYEAQSLRSNLTNPDTVEKLQKTDGVSDYSRAYWNQYSSTKKTYDYFRAIDETLAEISRHKATNNFAAHKDWEKLYKDIGRLSK